MRMTDRRALKRLPKYPGQADRFNVWRFALEGFLDEDPQFCNLIKLIAKQKQNVTTADLFYLETQLGTTKRE